MKRMYLLGLVMLLALGLAWQAVPAMAQTEVLYLTHSRISSSTETGEGTRLLRVDLDETSSQANLTLLYTLPAPKFDQVDALACTPDGMKVYAIDKNTASIGWLDPTTNSFNDTLKQVKLNGSIVPQIVLAAFGPGGQLYVASQSTSHIYTVDLATGAATDLGAAGVTLNGADLVFDASGNLFVFTNATGKLYQIALGPPNVPTEVVALSGSHFTGLAMGANGTGNFLGSWNGTPGSIDEFDSAGLIKTYNMYMGASPYSYWSGDMSIGPLRICTKTIGYWKNHSWENATVTICGEVVSENGGDSTVDGNEILWSARGNTWSMFYAQLIAAKLNTKNSTGYEVINSAEDWLCTNGPGIDQYSDAIPKTPKELKGTASGYWDALDQFNNKFECD